MNTFLPEEEQDPSFFDKTPFKKKPSSGSFQSFNLRPTVMKAVLNKGYKFPTPIQRKSIPLILEGENIVAMARTGSGKTASFLIPLISKLMAHSNLVGVRGLVISPTRQLCLQSASFFKQFAKYTDLRSACIIGGTEVDSQFERLSQNPDVLFATPGRLAHHLEETGISLKAVNTVIYDEADRMFEMGFTEQIYTIAQNLPKQSCQHLLFSATMPESLSSFALTGIKEYKVVKLDSQFQLSDRLKLHFFITRSDEKIKTLLYILDHLVQTQSLIFVSTKYHAQYISELLAQLEYSTGHIFGDMDQEIRKLTLTRFRKKKIKFLVVTDVAARGLDIPLLESVIHFDFPPSPKVFIHRSGRTARAAATGTAWSLLIKAELPYLFELQNFIGKKLENRKSGEQEERLNDPNYGHYGSVPTTAIWAYQDMIKKAHQENQTLNQLKQKSERGYSKYLKMRQSASKYAVTQAKEMLNLEDHLLFKTKTEEQGDTEEFMKQLKEYRPKQTVLALKTEAFTEEAEEIKRMFGKLEAHKYKTNLRSQLEKQEEQKETRSQNRGLGGFQEREEKTEREKVYLSKREKKLLKKGRAMSEPSGKRRPKFQEIKAKEYISNESSGVNWGIGGSELQEIQFNIDPEESDPRKKERKIKWDEQSKRYMEMVKSSKTGKFQKEKMQKRKQTKSLKERYEMWKK